MLVRSKTFDVVGMFDEDYFVYYDDTDFCFKLNMNKVNILYMSRLKIYHRVSYSSGGDDSDFSIQQNTKNKIIYIKKNYKLSPILVPLNVGAGVIKGLFSTKRSIYFSALFSGIKY